MVLGFIRCWFLAAPAVGRLGSLFEFTGQMGWDLAATRMKRWSRPGEEDEDYDGRGRSMASSCV